MTTYTRAFCDEDQNYIRNRIARINSDKSIDLQIKLLQLTQKTNL